MHKKPTATIQHANEPIRAVPVHIARVGLIAQVDDGDQLPIALAVPHQFVVFAVHHVDVGRWLRQRNGGRQGQRLNHGGTAGGGWEDNGSRLDGAGKWRICLPGILELLGIGIRWRVKRLLLLQRITCLPWRRLRLESSTGLILSGDLKVKGMFHSSH